MDAEYAKVFEEQAKDWHKFWGNTVRTSPGLVLASYQAPTEGKAFCICGHALGQHGERDEDGLMCQGRNGGLRCRCSGPIEETPHDNKT